MPNVRENPDKWARNSSTAGQSYKEGTETPRRQWLEATLEGEDNYNLAIAQAVANGRYGKGVQKSGQPRYAAAITEKGISRFTQGVLIPSAKARYQAGFKPFAAVLEALTLPPKQPKGQNLERVRIVSEALIAEKNKG